jgi:hypothetical protein
MSKSLSLTGCGWVTAAAAPTAEAAEATELAITETADGGTTGSTAGDGE